MFPIIIFIQSYSYESRDCTCVHLDLRDSAWNKTGKYILHACTLKLLDSKSFKI